MLQGCNAGAKMERGERNNLCQLSVVFLPKVSFSCRDCARTIFFQLTALDQNIQILIQTTPLLLSYSKFYFQNTLKKNKVD